MYIYIYVYMLYIYIHSIFIYHIYMVCTQVIHVLIINQKKEKQRLVHGLAGAVDLPRHRSRCLVARDDGLVIFRVIAIDSD